MISSDSPPHRWLRNRWNRAEALRKDSPPHRWLRKTTGSPMTEP
ncbi:hypothetical protein [uncultured Gammaproteobacteria bacterium]|nr:hypothetical protein [uncultured Gammaproteobacteria bacterium]